VLVLTPVEAMLLAGLGSCHPHDGRLDWLVPPLLQVGEYLFLAALAFSRAVSPPLVFAVIAAVVLRHLDVAYRARHRIRWPAAGAADGRPRKPGRRQQPRAEARPGQSPAQEHAHDRVQARRGPHRARDRAQAGSAPGRSDQARGPATQERPAGSRAAAASHGLTWPPTAADGRPADVTGLGWEVRMLALGVGAALGIMPFACIALAGYLWALTIRDFLTGWLGVRSEPA